MFGPPQQGITLPPGGALGVAPDESQNAISGMLGQMGGPQMTGEVKSAIGYIDAAFEMLSAAGDEVPQIAQAIEQVKEMATQIVGQALGMGAAPQPAMPPSMGGMPPMMGQ